jgi:hypothetical protein
VPKGAHLTEKRPVVRRDYRSNRKPRLNAESGRFDRLGERGDHQIQ